MFTLSQQAAMPSDSSANDNSHIILTYTTGVDVYTAELPIPEYFTYKTFIKYVTDNLINIEFIDGDALYGEFINVEMTKNIHEVTMADLEAKCLQYEKRIAALEEKLNVQKINTSYHKIHIIPEFKSYNEFKKLDNFKYFEACENPERYFNFVKKGPRTMVQFKEKHDNLIVLPCINHDGTHMYGSIVPFILVRDRTADHTVPIHYFKCHCTNPMNIEFTCTECLYTVPMRSIIDKYGDWQFLPTRKLTHLQYHYIVRYITGWFYLHYELYTKYDVSFRIFVNSITEKIQIEIHTTPLHNTNINETYMLIYPFERVYLYHYNLFKQAKFDSWFQ